MKTSNVLVSCIIPVFNREDMVLEAIDSVLSQTYSNIELVIVDDGSTDTTPDKLGQVTDQRVKLLRQDNQGVSAARNYAIAQSSGEYIALLDSDDSWLENKIESQLNFMRSGEFAISQTEEIWFRKGKRVNQMNKHAKPEGFFFEQAVNMCLISPSCVMFTRDYWNEIGPFDENLPACEDFDLWLRTLVKYPVGLLREKLTIKRGGRPDQLSNSIPCLDQYRIIALGKALDSGDLTQIQREAAITAMAEKIRIFHQGLIKREKQKEAQEIKLVAQKYKIEI